MTAIHHTGNESLELQFANALRIAEANTCDSLHTIGDNSSKTSSSRGSTDSSSSSGSIGYTNIDKIHFAFTEIIQFTREGTTWVDGNQNIVFLPKNFNEQVTYPKTALNKKFQVTCLQKRHDPKDAIAVDYLAGESALVSALYLASDFKIKRARIGMNDTKKVWEEPKHLFKKRTAPITCMSSQSQNLAFGRADGRVYFSEGLDNKFVCIQEQQQIATTAINCMTNDAGTHIVCCGFADGNVSIYHFDHEQHSWVRQDLQSGVLRKAPITFIYPFNDSLYCGHSDGVVSMLEISFNDASCWTCFEENLASIEMSTLKFGDSSITHILRDRRHLYVTDKTGKLGIAAFIKNGNHSTWQELDNYTCEHKIVNLTKVGKTIYGHTPNGLVRIR